MTVSEVDEERLLPRRRSTELAVRDLDGECIVYDHRTDQVTHLDRVTAMVWQRCDGTTSLSTAQQLTGCGEAELAMALARLAEADLLDADGVSRRRMIARVAAAGTLASLATIAAPTAAHAASGPVVGTVTLLAISCARGINNNAGSVITLNVRVRNWAPSTQYRVLLTFPAPPGPGTPNSPPTNSVTRTVTTNGSGSVTPQIQATVPRSNRQNPIPFNIEVFAPPPTFATRLLLTTGSLSSC